MNFKAKYHQKVLLISFAILVFSLQSALFGAGRIEQSLSGTWNFTPSGLATDTIAVPGFYIWDVGNFTSPPVADPPFKLVDGVEEASYATTFSIPASMQNKQIILHFESVNYVCDVFLNGVKIGSNEIGYTPFEFDITDNVTVPSSNHLRVDIQYDDPRFMDAQNNYITPFGHRGYQWHLGITGHVKIIARNALHISDAHIVTSFQDKTITSHLQISNDSDQSRSVTLQSYVLDQGAQVKSIANHAITLTPGEIKNLSYTASWTSPVLWTPDQPFLYTHETVLVESMQIIDRTSHTFGFREFWIEDTTFYLNGVPTFLRGDNLIHYTEKDKWKFLIPTPESMHDILGSLKSLHFNTIQLSGEPAPPWLYALCDEKGMFVIAASAMASHNVTPHSTDYHQNANVLIERWIKRDRNHPSIVIWNIENEMSRFPPNIYSYAEVAEWGKTAKALDSSRPLIFEGELDLLYVSDFKADIYSYHYFDKYWANFKKYFPGGWPSASLYGFLRAYKQTTKPTSWGEFEYNHQHVMTMSDWGRGQCLITRAGRILGVQDIRPYRLDWAWHPNPDYFLYKHRGETATASDVTFLKNTMAPVALFDRAYYEFEKYPDPPVYTEGDTMTRTFVALNHEFSGRHIEVVWKTRVSGVTQDSGSVPLTVELGGNHTFQLSCPVPYVPEDQDFTLQLNAWKDGRKRFSEDNLFHAIDIGINPPLRIQGFRAEAVGEHVRLTWDKSIPTTEGTPDSGFTFTLYKSDNLNFSAERTDSISTLENVATDTAFYHLHNPKTVFYRLKANKNGQTTPFTKTLVAVQYRFQSRGIPEPFYTLAIPFQQYTFNSASEWLEQMPVIETLAVWDNTYQGYYQYHPLVPPTDFTTHRHDIYYLRVKRDTTVTMIGQPESIVYTLQHHDQGQSWNDIMVPLNQSGILKASDLWQNIPAISGLAFWNGQLQTYTQYLNGVPATDFDIIQGGVYRVFVESSSTWPAGSTPKAVPEKKIRSQWITHGKLPHAVWGKLNPVSAGAASPAAFRAYIHDRPEEKLTQTSPGCTLQNDFWILQCASFNTDWQPGESLVIDWLDRAGARIGQDQIFLSAGAAEEILWQGKPQQSCPSAFCLYPAYPNPFNGRTQIKYDVPQETRVDLCVYNSIGRKVKTLVRAKTEPGQYEIHWNGKNEQGHTLSSGIYLIQIKTDNNVSTHKLMLVK